MALIIRYLRSDRGREAEDVEPEGQHPRTGAHLPALTPEMSGNVAQDPGFELDTQKGRGGQGF
jgi:hypothetical protein